MPLQRLRGRWAAESNLPFARAAPILVCWVLKSPQHHSISGLVVEYIVAIDVTRVRFPADAPFCYHVQCGMLQKSFLVRRGYATPTANMYKTKTTARGFEPLRAEPNGFRVHHLNRSVTLSLQSSPRHPSAAKFDRLSCFNWVLLRFRRSIR